MKLFIDSADIEEIRKINSYGILEGVTTNPSLIKKSIGKYKKYEKIASGSSVKFISKKLGFNFKKEYELEDVKKLDKKNDIIKRKIKIVKFKFSADGGLIGAALLAKNNYKI